MNINDTIVSQSTPKGVGPTAIIRVSGNKSIELVNKIFPSKDLNTVDSHTLHFGNIIYNNIIIDEVVISIFKEPRSYTKENIVEMDLGNLNSVKKFTEDFKESFEKLDILINNAGIMACPETRIGSGWESQFAVNHIGHFLLTKELMDTMAENDSARFVSLSSSAHSLTGILWDDIHFRNNSYDKWMAYGQSKTASSLIAIEFHRRMVDKGVSGFSVHPGGILTPLQRHLQKEEMVALGWMEEDGSPSEMAKNFFKTTSQGASTTLWCATSSSLNGIGGVFCEDCDIAKRKNEVDESLQRYFGVADWAVDTEEASKLWDITEKMLAS